MELAKTIIRLDINYDIPEDASPLFEAHETRIFTDTPEGVAEAIRQAQTINDPLEGDDEPDNVANEVEVCRCVLNVCAYVCSERIEIPEIIPLHTRNW